jgi:hypothetical protein
METKSMSEERTLSEDSASFAMLIAFPFEEEPFAAGLEAGMLWQGMWSGKEVIQMIVNAKLKEGIAVMARNRSYKVKSKKGPKPELIAVTLQKNAATRKKPRPRGPLR